MLLKNIKTTILGIIYYLVDGFKLNASSTNTAKEQVYVVTESSNDTGMILVMINVLINKEKTTNFDGAQTICK